MNGRIKLFAAVFLLAAVFALTAFADEITQSSIPTGRIGQNLSFSFQYTLDYQSEEDLYAIIDTSNASDTYIDPDADRSGIFPFELPSGTKPCVKLGKLSAGTHSVSFTLKLRHDLSEGYYEVPLRIVNNPDVYDPVKPGVYGTVMIYASSSAPVKPTETEKLNQVTFALGEGQMTPYGVYPDVMNFTLNLRNSGSLTAQDVRASVVCASASADFPFDINEANYDRHFDLIKAGETVELPYSFAIRKDTYSGYYPIKMNVTYRESSGGELKKEELTFFVHVKNREKEEQTTERAFNANDRVKARIVVESFRTDPEVVYAGQDFELLITMKNASDGVDASNILFTFEPEKANNAPAFTTQTGSNSTVVSALKSGETVDLKMYFSARAGIDPSSYSISISEKYDSPEFKNAEEKVSIDIPVKEISKFGLGNIELLPESIEVGSEINVMFPVNNTGKTMLYNTTVRFEADSINNSEIYLGNIKPGESANVDTMLKGIAATEDDGSVKIIVSYEDEYGEVTSGEKTVNFYVYETPVDESFEYIPEPEPEPEPPFYKKKGFVPGVLAGAVLLIVLITAAVKKIKKKKAEAGEKL